MTDSKKPPDHGLVPPASPELEVMKIEAPVDVIHLAQLFDAFIRAATPSDGRRILEQHPELLSDDVWWMTDRILESGREAGDAELVYVVHERRRVLKRCREVGLATALSEFGY